LVIFRETAGTFLRDTGLSFQSDSLLASIFFKHDLHVAGPCAKRSPHSLFVLHISRYFLCHLSSNLSFCSHHPSSSTTACILPSFLYECPLTNSYSFTLISFCLLVSFAYAVLALHILGTELSLRQSTPIQLFPPSLQHLDVHPAPPARTFLSSHTSRILTLTTGTAFFASFFPFFLRSSFKSSGKSDTSMWMQFSISSCLMPRLC